MIDIHNFKISIRTRILFMVMSLIIVIFLLILTAFNLLVREYVVNSVNKQLTEALQTTYNARYLPNLSLKEEPPSKPGFDFLPELKQLPRGPIGKAETIIISERYELLFMDANIDFIRNYDEINALTEQLKSKRIDLESDKVMQVKASDREYYFVSIRAPEVAEVASTGMAYLIYYIDMTAIASFADRINTMLLVIMCVTGVLAAAIATFFSGRIAEPIKELTRFAVRIGKGDFSTNTLNYQDTELLELAQSMNKAAVQLDTYDKEQKTFFQNVSHELRTPLQAIKCNAEGIEHGILTTKNASRVIINETDRLSEMVEGLLYISRIDNISKSSKLVECDLRELLSNCAERQRSLASERNLRFIFDFADQPINLLCDEKHMFRAFANLISNAIRYAKSVITLSCQQANDKIFISVVDDGEGIAEEDLPHIFDRFYKGDDGKHGIGLSIVKSIIEQHQGKIEVKNAEKGAIFTITFKKI